MRGNGRIFQRGSVFWISYYGPRPRDGKHVEIRESGGKTEKQAAKKLNDRVHEVRNHRKGLAPFHGPSREKVMVTDLLARLEQEYQVNGTDLRPIRSHLKHIRAAFGFDHAVTVTEDRLDRYVKSRQLAGAMPATINKELAPLQRAFRLAVKYRQLGRGDLPVFPRLAENNAREGFFNEATSSRSVPT